MMPVFGVYPLVERRIHVLTDDPKTWTFSRTSRKIEVSVFPSEVEVFFCETVFSEVQSQVGCDLVMILLIEVLVAEEEGMVEE